VKREVAKRESAAILTMKGVSRMTLQGRRDLAEWLDLQRELILSDGDRLSDRYRARYFFTRGRK